MEMKILQPPGWPAPIGYSNGIAVDAGRIVFVAGQIGWNAEQKFEGTDFVAQFEQALANVIEVLAQAGGRPEHICRMTAYCCDRGSYLAGRERLGEVWRRHMGRHYPAMSLVFVADLIDRPAVIELEATAVIPPAA